MLNFSIIIPTYNRPDSVIKCLEALSKLDYPRDQFEIIVVDDGSPQPVEPQLAGRFDHLPLRVIRQKNSGPGPARNTGARAATGRYLAFTDDDCHPEAGWLQAFERAFERAPDALLGGPAINGLPHNPYASASQSIADVVIRHYNIDLQPPRMFASNNIAVPREAFLDIEGFNEGFRLPAAEDRDLCDRWLFLGRRTVYVPQARVIHYSALTFKKYARQFYNYGRGARYFHHLRKLRGSGTLLAETRFHANISNWFFKPLAEVRGIKAKIMRFWLLFVWQAANAIGYYAEWQALRRIRDSQRE